MPLSLDFYLCLCLQDIELLQNHGINVADLKKLKAVGICTVKGREKKELYHLWLLCLCVLCLRSCVQRLFVLRLCVQCLCLFRFGMVVVCTVVVTSDVEAEAGSSGSGYFLWKRKR